MQKTATDRQVCKAIRASWICPSKGFLKWFVHKGYFFLSILKIFIFDYRPTLKSKEVTLQILYHYVSPNIIIFLLVVIIPEVVAHFWSSQGCMQKREKDLDQIQLMQCWMLMHCNGHHDLCIQKVWSITISFYQPPRHGHWSAWDGVGQDDFSLAFWAVVASRLVVFKTLFYLFRVTAMSLRKEMLNFSFLETCIDLSYRAVL